MEAALKGFTSATEHLLAALGRLDLLLQREALLVRAAQLLGQDEWGGLLPRAGEEEVSCPTPANEEADKLLAAAAGLNSQIDQMQISLHERAAGGRLPLPYLEQTFQLTPFEIDLLVLAAAPELDLHYARLFAWLQGGGSRPTVDLALRLFCAQVSDRPAALQMLRAGAPLFRFHLLALGAEEGDPGPAQTLNLDRRMLDFLCGQSGLDERLLPFADWIAASQPPMPSPCPAALQAEMERSLPFRLQGFPCLLTGAVGIGKLLAAAALCAAEGCGLLRIDLRAALAPQHTLATRMPLLWREAFLSGCALYFDHCELLGAGEDEYTKSARLALLRQLGMTSVPVFLATTEHWQPEEVGLEIPCLRFDFPLPDFAARLRLWEHALEQTPLAPDADLADLASKFTLTPRQVLFAAREAEQRTVLGGSETGAVDAGSLYAAARAQSSQSLSRLAQKIIPFYTWADLVAPARLLQQLQEICASVHYRHVVYGEWGFARKLALGRGLNVLFSGPSGAGKTMSAQIIAGELRLDLYKIDLAGVISKYIGETEKNLARIFAEAQNSNAILFFDEADALFGKRSEVKDSHDRYANIEVAYLLQKMEEYEGMVILATNLGKNMDDAFARRMHHSVEFPFPDVDHRERIWRVVLPAELPLAADVNFKFLARQFELAGGSIRNAALAAAFMAAQAGSAVTMHHLIRGVAREYQKLGKLPSQADFRQYYTLIGE